MKRRPESVIATEIPSLDRRLWMSQALGPLQPNVSVIVPGFIWNDELVWVKNEKGFIPQLDQSPLKWNPIQAAPPLFSLLSWGVVVFWGHQEVKIILSWTNTLRQLRNVSPLFVIESEAEAWGCPVFSVPVKLFLVSMPPVSIRLNQLITVAFPSQAPLHWIDALKGSLGRQILALTGSFPLIKQKYKSSWWF